MVAVTLVNCVYAVRGTRNAEVCARGKLSIAGRVKTDMSYIYAIDIKPHRTVGAWVGIYMCGVRD